MAPDYSRNPMVRESLATRAEFFSCNAWAGPSICILVGIRKGARSHYHAGPKWGVLRRGDYVVCEIFAAIGNPADVPRCITVSLPRGNGPTESLE